MPLRQCLEQLMSLFSPLIFLVLSFHHSTDLPIIRGWFYRMGNRYDLSPNTLCRYIPSEGIDQFLLPRMILGVLDFVISALIYIFGIFILPYTNISESQTSSIRWGPVIVLPDLLHASTFQHPRLRFDSVRPIILVWLRTDYQWLADHIQ